MTSSELQGNNVNSGKKKIWTGDLPQWFEGKRYQFFKVDMGTNLEDFTYAFSCN